MGIFKYSLLAAIAAAAPAVAVAQDDGASPVLQDFRLDPSRDPNRPRAPVRAGPEIGTVPDAVPLPSVNAPAVTPPPAVAATPPPVVAPTVRSPPRATRPRSVAEPETQAAPLPEAATATSPDPATEAAQPQSNATDELSIAPVAAPASVPETQAAATGILPWIIGGLVVLLFGALLLWRRRKTAEEPVEEPIVTPAPAVVERPTPAPIDVAPPTPVRSPTPAPVVTRARGDLPDAAPLTLTFTPLQARTTMVGAQLAYRLTLRNQGKAALDGLAIPALMINADAQQPQKLAAFFDDPFAPEAHRVAHLAPGAEVTVESELRLDQIVPIEVQGRALLIPLVAFKVISLDGDELSRATFIVGQESNPPRAKMAPLRLDRGPRQFRDIGSRPAQEMIAA
ncbi:MAG: hypothetical protein ACSLE1_20475 [Sphingobium sp.]